MQLKNLAVLLPAFASSSNVPERTVLEILEHVNSIPKTWKSGLNKKFNPASKPSDHNLHSILNYDENSHINNPHPPHRVPNVADEDIPASFDPRDKWGAMCKTLYEITDQGPCASSWAMADCCHGCTPFQGGCYGGYMPQNWISFKNYGISSGGLYGSNDGCKPYDREPCEHWEHQWADDVEPLPQCDSFGVAEKPVCDLACSNSDYSVNYYDDLIKMDDYYGITSHRVSDIQKELMTNGPIETTFQVYDDFLTYESGVYYHVDGRKQNYIHSLRLLGWGVDEETNMDYWLVANSWNADWGENGYFRVRRGTNECGIEGTMYMGNMAGWEV